MVQKRHSIHSDMTHHYQPFAMVNQNLFSCQFYCLLSDEGWKNEHIMTPALKISLTKGIIHAQLLLTAGYCRPKLTSPLQTHEGHTRVTGRS